VVALQHQQLESEHLIVAGPPDRAFRPPFQFTIQQVTKHLAVAAPLPIDLPIEPLQAPSLV
jgi:hypothetical protein